LRDLSDEDVENSCGDCSDMNEEVEHTILCGETVTLLGIAKTNSVSTFKFMTEAVRSFCLTSSDPCHPVTYQDNV